MTLFSGIGGDLRLLETFLDYYRTLGVGRIFLCLHQKQQDRGTAALVEEVAKRFDAVVDSMWVDPGLNHTRRYELHRAMIKRRCSDSDWALLADLDEFQHYRCGLEAAVHYCERESKDYVKGHFVDRIAEDGGFPALQANRIWQQFPLECELTRNVLKGNPNKIGLFRAWVEVGPGHHSVFQRCPSIPCSAEELSVEFHHFKWDAEVIERLRERRDDILSEGWDFWQEPDAFLTYIALNAGKIDISDELLQVRRSKLTQPRGQHHPVGRI